MTVITQAVILSLPLIFSGVAHMAVVKADLLPRLKVPLHSEWFGRNKTWRGVLIVPLTTVLGVKMAAAIWPATFGKWNWFALGVLLGIAYVAFELPNSFIKRRMGIEPGKRPTKNAAAYALADQADSAIGCALVYWYVLDLPPGTVLLLILMGPTLHLIVNFSLYLVRLRKEPI